MTYTTRATSLTPALVIYVIDVSASMAQSLGNTIRLSAVVEALTSAIDEMVQLSTKGRVIAPRYRLAILAYSDEVYDLLSGVRPIDQVAQLGIPELPVGHGTNPAAAFAEVERLLLAELPTIQAHPAPLICHLTDGEYDPQYEDPEPIAHRLMAMSVEDGSVLIENIFISDNMLFEREYRLPQWKGIQPDTRLTSKYAEKLRRMSSRFPDGYRLNFVEKQGGELTPDSLMLLPGTRPELIRLGFQITATTGVVG